MLSDPSFYAVGIPAVVLIGLSKGGLGGAMALLGVPLMALVMSPVQAAAILLPILIVMDMVGLWTWRHDNDRKTLAIMLPGALVGIAAGWALAAYVTDTMIRLIVGLVALWFVVDYLVKQRMAARNGQAAGRQRVAAGSFWGALSGFTSFIAHAGGPPYQIYALPLHMPPRKFVGTSTRFFAVVNAVKVLPYFALGQFDAANLKAAAVLMPVAPLATLAGAWLVRRMKPSVFYPFMYAMVMLAAIKLIWDGVAGISS
ncbi:sulfite exporter TauE/SafE family protein [Pararhizobium haloflavum]|uniref:sulfite exporter TauE/SafE family protein n=1 Tax=Pararhizobium haloflavum TaxID=2037914 RepID=UPI000C17CC41|nr:sulfite exporter TauE/SafE family protein [Pararhizobium haloflavum]